jgi:hypothetical protein
LRAPPPNWFVEEVIDSSLGAIAGRAKHLDARLSASRYAAVAHATRTTNAHRVPIREHEGHRFFSRVRRCGASSMSVDSKQHHEALLRRTFSVVEHAAAEFRALLPASLVERINFSTLKLCSGSYVDEALTGSQSDLLFSVNVSGKPALLYGDR